MKKSCGVSFVDYCSQQLKIVVMIKMMESSIGKLFVLKFVSIASAKCYLKELFYFKKFIITYS